MAYDDAPDEDVVCQVTIAKADFVGTCLRCFQPTIGSYDSDDGKSLKMRCVNCRFKQTLELDPAEKLELTLTFSG